MTPAPLPSYRLEELAQLAGVPQHYAARIAARAGLEPTVPGRVGRGNVARYGEHQALPLVVAHRLLELGYPDDLLRDVIAFLGRAVGLDPGPLVHPSTVVLVVDVEAAEKVAPLLVPHRNLGGVVAQRGAVYVVDLHLGVR